MLEGPQTIAGFIIETVTGTNGIHVPPDGYLEGVRALCDKHGILLICDEVMSGFGRTGEWFAVDHWKVVPDILTMAKGLTSAYVALGAVGIRRKIADHFKDKVYLRRPHLQQPSARLRRGAGDDRRVRRRQADRARPEDGRGDEADARGAEGEASLGRRCRARSASSGSSSSCKNRKTMEPLAPFNGTSPEMQALGKFFREEGLYTFVRWNGFFTNPPLTHHRGGDGGSVRDHRQGSLHHGQGDRLTILLFGATGLAGSGVLRACLDAPAVTEVRALVRRSTGVQHPKLREIVHADYLDYGAVAGEFAGVDACFFCLGVSVSQVPDEAAYRRIHQAFPIAAATLLRAKSPAAQFHYLSGGRAALNSRWMWARVAHLVTAPACRREPERSE